MNDPVVASADVDVVALQRLRRFGGDKLVREMAALFIEHAPSRLAAARDGLTRHDAPTVKAALHVLKSSAGQIGASRMHRLGLSRSLPGLVLLDISLPGMDGSQILQHIRADDALRDLPVIALTAHAMTGDRERYLAAGFDDYITKPIVDETLLIGAIERWLASGRRASTPSGT